MMRINGRPTSSHNRRALHERTPSQKNLQEARLSQTRSVNLVDGKEDADVYATTPYPTKPEHILLPRPGKGLQIFETADSDVSDTPEFGTATISSSAASHDAEDILAEHSFNSAWDLSSTGDGGHTPSLVFDQACPVSSRSSLPEPAPPGKGLHDESESEVDIGVSDDGRSALPTIKPVTSEPSSPPSRAADHSDSGIFLAGDSTPNVIPIGRSSSPNVVTLDVSSPNFYTEGNFVPNSLSATRSNSQSSTNSLGTVVRYIGAAPWARSSPSDHSSSGSQSFPSSPPDVQGALIHSPSSFIRGLRDLSRSPSADDSSLNGHSAFDVQAMVESGISVQVPISRIPSGSSSWVDASVSDVSQLPSMSNLSSAQIHRLPTLPDQDTAGSGTATDLSTTTSPDDQSSESMRKGGAVDRPKPAASLWLVTNSSSDENLDNISTLPAALFRDRIPGLSDCSASSASRQQSLRSLTRPGTSSSLLSVLPTWATVYYRNDGRAMNTAISALDSRPSTGRSNVLSRLTTGLNPTVSRLATYSDPRDPRSHWVHGQGQQDKDAIVMLVPSHDLARHNWSPHLHNDKGLGLARHRGSTWAAPSLDSSAEPVFGRRNIQVYSFCIGFVFPLSWLVAAFLPLPRKPKLRDESLSDFAVETALQMRLLDYEGRRYKNARWWRNLNRWMSPLGVAIIAVIVTLAVVGTQVGL